jgi:hypothetical protein
MRNQILGEARKAGRGIKQAVKLMKTVNFPENIITRFEKGEVTLSNYGKLEMLSQAAKELVEKVEKDGYLVYHVIFQQNKLYILYVSPCEEDWDYEIATAKNGFLLSACQNITYPEWSEHGMVEVKPFGEGVKRVG